MALPTPPRTARLALISGAASLACCFAADAKDLAATPEGAKTIAEFFTTYGGAAAAPPALTVTPEGADYRVSLDVVALNALLAPAGVSYDPATIALKVFSQDDGAWRVEMDDFPLLQTHQKTANGKVDATIAVSGIKAVNVLDPSLCFVRSGDTSVDKTSIAVHGSGIDETIDFQALKATMSGAPGADGTVSAAVNETIGPVAFTFNVDPQVAHPKSITDAKPVAISGGADSGAVGIKFDGWKMKPILDAWAFWVAHPSRAELAANEAAFKTRLAAAIKSQPSVGENVDLNGLVVNAPQGPITVAKAQFSFGGAAAAQASHFEEHFKATGLSLPAAIVPAMFHDLVPTAFDFGFKVTGFDLNAAAEEAIADLHFSGDDPVLSKADNDKVTAKLLASGSFTVDVPPSHVAAPGLDIAFEGHVRIVKNGKPTGTITVHMRDFDKTVTALKGLGPDAQKQMVPALAMVKGLAKTEADGALSWVGEIGDDGVMKVNGLPLGKAPF